MVNLNGTLTKNNYQIATNNRGFAFGDAVFETMRVVKGKIIFWEDHYFRLMAGMRIMRMEIPMTFTMEFLEAEILKTAEATGLQESQARVKLSVYRESEGFYTPVSNDIGYVIAVQKLEEDQYLLNTTPYRVDIFKDYPVAPGLLSTIKSNNRAINVVGSIYAQENDLDNCILINSNKQVVEALNSNLFLVHGKIVKTPPILDGCIKGIIRQQLIEIIKGMEDYELEESSISPFEIQRADELFLTNSITGIRPVTAYRKKEFTTKLAGLLVEELNRKAGI